MSMTDQTQSGISDVKVNECNMTMTKSLRKSMFNEPMSVRGIKRIEIEEIEKIKAAKKEGKSPDGRQYATGSDSDADSQDNSGIVQMKPPPLGKGIKQQHKLTLTNIVEEEISPTSKSTASILSKPKNAQLTQTLMINVAGAN